MELTKTLGEYLDELSSNSPTPGGGNVSALCATLASCLGTMVCNLTIGKRKYADVEAEISSIKEKLEGYRQKFIDLAQKDNQAFDKVMDAFKMPKETEQEKALRSQQIEEATYGAAKVPAEVVKSCSEVIPLIQTIVEKGNRNSLSDAGVAALLLSTAAQGAFLNVLINCSSLKDQALGGELLQTAETMSNEVKTTGDIIADNIKKELRQ
ncbi:MAG: cyclodeaminase/cyclohydrolase family protein [Bacteroidota bacterium]|nr:cyclodeaminase/cyclohydrolase family protein [Bacteroidota bacterium]MDP4191590.1 cyclodeaminase/cyclohydrolase family protein [Bacteroidota bacterium]MDP4196202.1 cyclodeaminase/cyclohydrolase family protein [Bacteroidota bacterium]